MRNELANIEVTWSSTEGNRVAGAGFATVDGRPVRFNYVGQGFGRGSMAVVERTTLEPVQVADGATELVHGLVCARIYGRTPTEAADEVATEAAATCDSHVHPYMAEPVSTTLVALYRFNVVTDVRERCYAVAEHHPVSANGWQWRITLPSGRIASRGATLESALVRFASIDADLRAEVAERSKLDTTADLRADLRAERAAEVAEVEAADDIEVWSNVHDMEYGRTTTVAAVAMFIVAVLVTFAACFAIGSLDGRTLQPCETEDSANCYWNAAERGNGIGSSFVDIDGVVYTFGD